MNFINAIQIIGLQRTERGQILEDPQECFLSLPKREVGEKVENEAASKMY